jgi:hypothetical protein
MSRDETIGKVKAAIADADTPAELRAELEGALKVLEAPSSGAPAPQGPAPQPAPESEPNGGTLYPSQGAGGGGPRKFDPAVSLLSNRYGRAAKKDGQ